MARKAIALKQTHLLKLAKTTCKIYMQRRVLILCQLFPRGLILFEAACIYQEWKLDALACNPDTKSNHIKIDTNRQNWRKQLAKSLQRRVLFYANYASKI